MFGEGFVLIPWECDEFGGDVLYVEDPATYIKQFVHSSPETTNTFGGSKLSRIKAKHWNDQSEFRFTLMAVLGPDLNYLKHAEQYENEFLNLIEKWQRLETTMRPPEITFIDLPVNSEVLNRMTVTLGSCISEEDRENVLQSILRYAPDAIIKESKIQAR